MTRLRFSGFSFLSRDSGGGLILAAYHPRSSATWIWSLSIIKRNGGRLVSLASHREGQWHHYAKLPFGKTLCLSRQDYHKRKAWAVV